MYFARMRATRYWPLAAGAGLLCAGRSLRRGRAPDEAAALARRRCSARRSSLLFAAFVVRRAACCRLAAARRARRLVRASRLVVDAARPLVGLREPRARLSALRAGRALARRPDAATLAVGLAVLLGAVAVWALLGKVPSLPGSTRRRSPAPDRAAARPGRLWNQLALLGDFALPLGLWLAGRRRIVGSLLAFVLDRRARPHLLARRARRRGPRRRALVRLRDERLDAFGDAGRRGVCRRRPSSGRRVRAARDHERRRELAHDARHDGVVFGVVLARRAAASTAALARVPRPRDGAGLSPRAARCRRRRRGRRDRGRRSLKGGAAWRSFTSSTEVANGAGRFGVGGLELPLGLVAAGLAGLQPPQLDGDGRGLVPAHEPALPPSSARHRDRAARPAGPVPQRDGDRRAPLLLAGDGAGAPARLAAAPRAGAGAGARAARVSRCTRSSTSTGTTSPSPAPAFLVAGALAGRARAASGASRPSRCSPAAGAALAAFGALLLPWLGHRWSGQAQAALGRPAHAATLATPRASCSTRCSIDPSSRWRFDARAAGQAGARVRLLRRGDAAAAREPETWQAAGLFALASGCSAARVRQPRALHGARPVRAGRPTAARSTTRALKLVNAGEGAVLAT